MRQLTRGVLYFGLAAVLALVVFWAFAPAYVEKGRNAVAAHDPYPVSDAALALHQSLIIGDWHADSLLWNRDLTIASDYGQVDLPRLQDGNVAIQVFTAVTKSPAGLNYDQNSADGRDNITLLAFGQRWPIITWFSIFERAIYQAEKLHRFEDARPDQLKIIRGLADLETVLVARAGGLNQIAGILGIEGAHPLEGDIANLDRLERAGYRLIALQHFFDNELGGSLHGIGDAGLTDFGRLVVAEVANRGMILDVAHSSQQVVRDVLAQVDIPIVVSHTGLHSLCQTKRNLPDELMWKIAQRGGVIGIGYWADVTCDDRPAGVARMIKAAIAEIGEDAVSLGSDFDGSVATAFDTSELAAITHELLAQGVPEAHIRKVMGGNMLRLLRARLK